MKQKIDPSNRSSDVFRDFRNVKSISIQRLGIVLGLALLLLLGVFAIGGFFHIPIKNLTSDPAAVAGQHPLIGMLSNLGVVFWCVAATSCILAALLLWRRIPRKYFLFLLFSFLLSTFLMFDDLFQFHEDLSDTIGLNQKIIYVFLGLAMVSFLYYFKDILLQTQLLPFGIALGCLGISVVTDTVVYKLFGDQLGPWLYLIEDGSKWIGIVFWSYYFFYTSYRFIKNQFRDNDIA